MSKLITGLPQPGVDLGPSALTGVSESIFVSMTSLGNSVPFCITGLRAGTVECAGMQMDLPPPLCADAWQDLWALVVRWMLMTA